MAETHRRGCKNSNALNYLEENKEHIERELIIFPCFSLPNPSNFEKYKGNRQNNIGAAIQNHWNSTTKIHETLSILNSGEEHEHPLSELDWTQFEKTLRETGNSLILCWASHNEADGISWRKFFELKEDEFFNPNSQIEESNLRIERLSDGADLSLGVIQPQNDDTYFISVVSESDLFVSELVSVILPRMNQNIVLDETDIANSSISIETHDTKVKFNIENCHINDDGDAALTGYFESSNHNQNTKLLCSC